MRREPIRFTVYTATQPGRLTKAFGLDAVGRLTKATVASMAEGIAERIEVADLGELAARLDALTPAQAVGWGIAAQASVNIATATSEGRGRIARTREHFAFASGPGVLMLDHDGLDDGALTADERSLVRAKLQRARSTG